MSRTDKTSRHRKASERTRKLAEELIGRPAKGRDMTRLEAVAMMSDARYGSATPEKSGNRYGNQRNMRAALKVSKRRSERRADNRIPQGE